MVAYVRHVEHGHFAVCHARNVANGDAGECGANHAVEETVSDGEHRFTVVVFVEEVEEPACPFVHRLHRFHVLRKLHVAHLFDASARQAAPVAFAEQRTRCERETEMLVHDAGGVERPREVTDQQRVEAHAFCDETLAQCRSLFATLGGEMSR